MSTYPSARRAAVDNGPLFDGLRRKESGRARAEARDPSLAERVRDHLRQLASDGRAVSIDDARDHLDALGLTAPSPSWWGSIFRGPEWVIVGYERSRRPSKNAHRQPLWKLRRCA